jgi:Putative esterase
VYRTEASLQRALDVHYPSGRGRIVLRTELDWDRDVEPVAVSEDGSVSSFRLEAQKPYLYLKPCLKSGDGTFRWAVGPNALALMTAEGTGHLYPYFEGSESGSFSRLLERDSTFLGRKLFVRVYLPPGYEQNPLRRYPVLYMQDGKNLFFPQEAFLGHEWKVDLAVSLLDRMNAMDRVVVVGVYSGDRMEEYTKPGYEDYARAVVEEVKPAIDRKLRVFDSPRETGVIGSSLGGVVSFYMAWEYPHVFGYAACMSSTFSHKDDLVDRGYCPSPGVNPGFTWTADGRATISRSLWPWPWRSSAAGIAPARTSSTSCFPPTATTRPPGGGVSTCPCRSAWAGSPPPRAGGSSDAPRDGFAGGCG